MRRIRRRPTGRGRGGTAAGCRSGYQSPCMIHRSMNHTLRGKRAPAKRSWSLRPEKRLDAGPQRGRHLLVGIERERPRLGGVGERPVLGVAVAAPLGLKHDGAMPLGDHFAVVGRPIQHDDDLGDPALHACEAARQVARLVAGDDDDGKGEGFSHGGTQMDTDTLAWQSVSRDPAQAPARAATTASNSVTGSSSAWMASRQKSRSRRSRPRDRRTTSSQVALPVRRRNSS